MLKWWENNCIGFHWLHVCWWRANHIFRETFDGSGRISTRNHLEVHQRSIGDVCAYFFVLFFQLIDNISQPSQEIRQLNFSSLCCIFLIFWGHKQIWIHKEQLGPVCKRLSLLLNRICNNVQRYIKKKTLYVLAGHYIDNMLLVFPSLLWDVFFYKRVDLWVPTIKEYIVCTYV